MFSKIKSAIIFIVVAGILLAVLRRFDNDPIAAADWVISWAWEWIQRVADVVSGNDSFKEVTKKPTK